MSELDTAASPAPTPAVAPPPVPSLYQNRQFTLRRKVFKLFGAAFHIYDPQGGLAFYSKQQAFKLKEDIRLYSDESMSEELLCIQARAVLDFSASYDVVDSKTGEHVGSLRRKGFKSIIRDEWLIVDTNEVEVGTVQEDSQLLALIRRFLVDLIPQTFTGTLRGKPVFTFRQRFNPFIQKLDLDFSIDGQGDLDRRLGIAAAVLICAIEGRQS